MNQRVLGVDPGTLKLGYGIVDPSPRPALVSAGLCQAPSSWSVARRLQAIQAQLEAVILEHRPTCVALETSFYGKNAQAMLRLGEARGVIIGLAGRLNLEVHDYSPAVIKKAVTGRGNASKDTVAHMVRSMVEGIGVDSAADTTDAVATALCHCHRDRQQLDRQGLATAGGEQAAARNPVTTGGKLGRQRRSSLKAIAEAALRSGRGRLR